MNKIVKIFLVALALCAFTEIVYAQQSNAEQQYQQALYEMEGKGDYSKAIESFTLVMTKFPKEKVIAAKALLNIGRCYEKLGKSEALKAYERILIEFKDQSQVVAEARTRLAVLKQPEDTVQPQFSNRQISTGTIKFQDISAPSPDGRFLSYSDNNKNVLGIYDIQTGESKILSDHSPFHDSIWVEESIWSPDGKQLAYEFNDWFYHTEIHLVNADGTEHRVLCSKTDTTATYINFYVKDWSPDGKLILATYSHGSKSSVGAEQIVTSELLVISVDDGSIRVVKIFDGWGWGDLSKMFFSPDSRFITFSYPTEKKSKICDVFVMGVDGSNEINITQHPADDRVLGWESNMNRLLFESDRGGTNNFWATQIAEGKPQGFPKLIRNNIAKVSSMGMISNGSLYYYLSGTEFSRNDFNIESNVYLANLDPSTGKILSQPKAATLNNNGFNHSHSWSPDGKQLLYYSVLGKSQNSPKKLFIINSETGNEKEVKHQLGADSSLGGSSWFPDGKNLATNFYRLPNGENVIYKLEVETGGMTPLVISKDTMFYSQKVSPDGKTLFFNSNFGGIYSFDLERKARKLLFQMGKDQYLRNSVLSPDGKYLAFALVTYEPQYTIDLMIMSSSGGKPTSIFKTDVIEFFARSRSIRWSPDGKYIYFAKESERNSKIELFRISVQEGTLESTGFAFEGLHDFFFRPDGKEIAFCAAAQPERNIWVMENIFAEARTQTTKLSGLTTHRILAEASKIGNVLTADGKYIRNLDENTGDILQFEISSGDTARIKNKSKWSEKEKSFQDVVFSHDGKQIVYNIEVFDPETKCWGYPLQIRNLDGSNLRTLYDKKGSYYLRPLDWSPDEGSILVFLSHKNVIELALISIADSSLHVIKNISPGWQQFQTAKFSPNGKFIAMNKMLGGNTPNSDLLLITADGRNEYVVAEHSAEDQLIGWTPDGLDLIFFSDRTGTWDIWMAHIANGKQLGESELLKKDFGWDTDVLGFAPDGSLFYKTQNSMGRLFTGSIDIETGKILTPPSPATTRYTSPPVQTIWSPDGKNIAYISRWNFMHPGNSRLTIRSEATGKERFLTPRLRFVNQISWAPDGKSIIALGLEETSQGIYQIDIKTSEIKKLTDEGVAPRLCPDGKNLLFVKGGPIIMKRNLETGETSEVVKIKGINYDLSPDGREIVYQVDSLVKIISINGGESRVLFSNSKVSPKWTKDGRFIIVGAKGSLWRIPAQGGTLLKLDLTFPKMQFLTIHPDNSRFAFSVNEESKSELWELENFLPKEKK